MNNRALDIAKELETMFMETPSECEEAAAELRRLIEVEKQHNKLRDQRNELLEALKDYDDTFTGFDPSSKESRHRMRQAVIKARAAIAKAGDAA